MTERRIKFNDNTTYESNTFEQINFTDKVNAARIGYVRY